MITLAVPLSAIAVLLAAGAQAGAQTSHSWASYDTAAASLYSRNPSVAQWAFNPPASYLDASNDTGTANPNPDGLTATAMAHCLW